MQCADANADVVWGKVEDRELRRNVFYHMIEIGHGWETLNMDCTYFWNGGGGGGGGGGS